MFIARGYPNHSPQAPEVGASCQRHCAPPEREGFQGLACYKRVPSSGGKSEKVIVVTIFWERLCCSVSLR